MGLQRVSKGLEKKKLLQQTRGFFWPTQTLSPLKPQITPKTLKKTQCTMALVANNERMDVNPLINITGL